jgi:hypothetical protein
MIDVRHAQAVSFTIPAVERTVTPRLANLHLDHHARCCRVSFWFLFIIHMVLTHLLLVSLHHPSSNTGIVCTELGASPPGSHLVPTCLIAEAIIMFPNQLLDLLHNPLNA